MRIFVRQDMNPNRAAWNIVVSYMVFNVAYIKNNTIIQIRYSILIQNCLFF